MEENLIYCDKCNENMKDGYELHNGLYHYCSDECLFSEIDKEEYLELYKEGFAFWTTFEE
ncbi:hypothetical protein CHF27_011125 [Romboutsia maritimum]|uniref:Uncharacterized protein n=1 Tax=Romboutsia maritimum TaxID=2020948 RepID=A0A371IQV1_9FIRM|nr:hypothetical protein [Romboutsia maritimum]RDY22865.1 hypothetical protein CHF27_011125 [Romboutsia maritimum]